MPAPENCPDAVYKLMLSCWEADPENRPKFADLMQKIAEMEEPEPSEPVVVDNLYLITPEENTADAKPNYV